MNPVWRIPIVLGVITLVGLVSAIAGDGIWDSVSWIGLSVPVVLSVRRLRGSWRKFAGQR